MVEIDWKKLMGLKPESLSEGEKDDLYETVARYTPEFNLDRKYLIHFVRVTQEVLKYKAEQVEYLTNELDEVAAKQGKEEGSKLQQYVDEIEQLREELEYHKKVDRSSSRSTYASNEELRREMVKLEMQNEELLGELKEKEKDLVNEKEEAEKYASQLVVLEREKQELIRELRALQDEATEKSNRDLRDSPEFTLEKQEELLEVIRQKNKHISQLLEDIDLIEKENFSLREKLTNVRDELAETTTHITEITTELSKLKHLNEEYESKDADSADRIKGMSLQIEELVEEKAKHDKQLDEYVTMFNSKLEEWREVLSRKDEEIMNLNEENKRLNSSKNVFAHSDVGDSKLIKKILQQEEQINILQQELRKATEDINCSTELIERLKKEHLKSISAPVSGQSTTIFLEEKIKVLEEKLLYAEEDAQTRAEEMSDLVIQLREYESGVFGLTEAVGKIKKLEKVLQKKDLQIEKLVQICNNLEIKVDSFEEQNMSLRERLGLTASDEIDTSGVKLKFKKDEELMENLKLRLDKKEEELIKAKLKYRKVVKYLKSLPPMEITSPEMSNNANELQIAKEYAGELDKKLQVIIKENDSLRKGMHEILESIRKQDYSGTVEVQSACLERLLEALDSRHVSGWYHPAMRLQAQLNSAEGKNEELRNQIRSLKTEEKRRSRELQDAYLKIQSLECDLSTPRYEEKKIIESRMSEDEHINVEEVKTPPVSEKVEAEVVKKILDIKKSSNECRSDLNQEEKIIAVEKELQQLKMKFNSKKAELDTLQTTTASEKEELMCKIVGLECQVKELTNQNPELTKISELTSQLVVLERKVDFLKALEAAYRHNNEQLRQDMIEEEEKLLRVVLQLQNDKSKLLQKIEKLEESLLSTVPQEKYHAVSKDLASMTAKYQHAVSAALLQKDDDGSGRLQSEVILLQEEKQRLLDELKAVKEKLIAAEGLMSDEVVTKGDFSNEISNLAGKLAACEVRELNEKQKSSHLEKINEILKSQQQEVEARNGELLEQVMKLTKKSEKHQEVERDLRMKVLSQLSSEDMIDLKHKIESLEKKCKELALEKDSVQELFEISQGQCRAFQEWKDADKILLASQNEQILLLQCSDDDKATISRLSHELAMAKLLTSQLTKKNNDLKMNMTKLMTQNLSLEVKIDENRREILATKEKHLALTVYMYKAMDEVRKLYGAAVSFHDVENLHNAKVELKESRKQLREKMDELKIQIKEYKMKKEEMETQLESLEDLKLAMRGDTKNLISMHNRTTELRLKEARCRRKNEFLTGEMLQLESCIKKLNEEITTLEESNVEKEKEWERKQILWEEAQLEMCQLLQDRGIKKKMPRLNDASTNTENITQKVSDQILKAGEQEKVQTCQWKMQELEAEVTRLRKEGEEEEQILTAKEEVLNNLNGKTKAIELDETISREKVENAEKEALKVTMQSLQNIIKQKEDTILRYQDLLKEGREEYSKACTKFQEELKSMNEALTMQNKAYNKLKNAVQANHFATENIPAVVEKYVTKIQELEEELRECQMNLSSVNTQAYTNQQEVEKWRNLATERLLLMEDMRQKIDNEYKDEIKNHDEEIRKYEKEIGDLHQVIESLRSEAPEEEDEEEEHRQVQTLQQIQVKSLEQEADDMQFKSDRLSDTTYDKPGKEKTGQLFREMETLKRQLKFSQNEATRLREQVRLLQSQVPKRPKTGSSSGRSDSKCSVKEGTLTNKIKHLEELLTVSKERERELMEINQKKIKSAEEVARWNERKKNQHTIENLTQRIKEKETEVEVLKNKNESFRNMVYRCERDKNILEAQLKTAKSGPGGLHARIEKLTEEKNHLQEEVTSLQHQLEEQLRHSGGIGAALLQEKLEEQERKLATLELASRGQSPMVDELERIKILNSNLEKSNLKLESENLSLQLKLEKEKSESKYLLDKLKQLQRHQESMEDGREVKRQESDRMVSSLQKTVERLTDENKRLRVGQREPRSFSVVDKVRKELTKLKEDHKVLRAKYMEALDRNILLEEEVKSYRYQMHLMEEKDLAEILTRTNSFQVNSELSQELIDVKTKLAHKNHLLSRVKTLLVKAAAKKKALHQEVCFLQNMMPQSAVHE